MSSPEKTILKKTILSGRRTGAAPAFGGALPARLLSKLPWICLTRERALVLASLLAVAALYACLANYFNSFHAFWSPDSGARFAMIQNGIQHGGLTSPYR